MLASVVAYLATPVAVRVARRLEFYDHPSGGYKTHAMPTPYLGGAAILVALVAATPVLELGDDRLFLLFGGAVILWLTGTIDDRRPLSPVMRVAIECAAGLGLYAGGEHWHLGLGPVVDAVATVVWVVGVVNAFNLIDNMDGVASVLGLAAAATVAVLASIEGDLWLTVAAVTMAGACLGFLPHNLMRPPRIFLGDGGSMLIGFGAAAMAVMVAADEGSAGRSLMIGLMVVALPVADMAVRVLARRRRGISPLVGGRDSVTHHARVILPTARAVAFTLGGLQILIAGAAITASQTGPWSEAALVLVFLILVAGGVALVRGEAPAGVDARVQSGGHALVRNAPALASSLVLALIVAGAPFVGGYYAPELWAPAGLAAAGLLVAALVSHPVRLERPAVLVLGALAALAVWALLSSAWAHAAGQAVLEGNRFVLYTLLLGLLILSSRSHRSGGWHVGFLAAAVAGVAIVLLGQMAAGKAGDLFLGGRLHEPLGYINGLGAFFLIGFWPLLAIAEQRRSAVVAGLAMAGACLAAVLMLLSQSRGVAVAALASILVVMVAVPGRLRRAIALTGLSVGVALIAGSVGELYRSGLEGAVDRELGIDVAVRALVIAAATGALWGIAVTRFRHRARAEVRRAAIATLCIAVVAVGAVGAWNGGRVVATLDHQYHAFVSLSPAAGGEATSSRLLSGVGYRYDYWRVALRSFAASPVAGVGAGNYPATYFRERATAEDVRQPHSLGLQTLAELGLVGGLLLAALLAAIVVGARRMIRSARTDLGDRLFAVAGIGSAAAWFAHSNVDWIHLLPGVTLIALTGIALLLRPVGAAADQRETVRLASGRRRPAIVAGVAVALALVLASMSLARQTISETYLRNARNTLGTSPQSTLGYVDRALRLDPDLVPAYYTRAAALARLGDGIGSMTTLRQGLRRDPENFVTMALLGDLSVRLGELPSARRWYARAHVQNPLEPGLEPLSRDPAAATGNRR